MLTSLGFDCLSQGTYNNPSRLGGDAQRPEIHSEHLIYDPKLNPLAQVPWGSPIAKELIDWCDIVWVLGIESWIPPNIERLKNAGKKMIFRSIGQAVPHTESVLASARKQGLKIVRYSPLEKNIPGYCGEDAMIRFYKDESVYKGWTGEEKKVITVAQSMKKREPYLLFSVFDKATRVFPRMLYGPGNEDVGELFGGRLEFPELLEAYRKNRVFFYTGTYPAPYTMGFQEALVTGIPVVSVGRELAWYLETPDFLVNGVHGFVSDDMNELRNCIRIMLEDDDYAKDISANGRKKGIKLFGKEKIWKQWKEFLES